MIVKEELLSKLRRYFDLNLYEVKLWTALLSRGVSTAGELSDIADVPRSRSYDVLESLEKKGFVVMKLGKPIKYIAIPPTEVVDRVKKHMHHVAQEKVKRLDSVRGSPLMSELETLHSTGINLVDPTEMSGCLRGRNNLYNHLDYLIKESRKNVNIITTEQGFLRKVEGLRGSFEKARRRGVRIRLAAPITKESKKVADSLKGTVDIRHNDKLDSRFVTIDGKDVVFMAMHDKDVHPSYDIGVWVKAPYFASTLDTLFNQAWNGGK